MFIPSDKMKTLREAAKNGDERAKNIIEAHFQKKDYSADLEDYFKPKEENKSVPVAETVTKVEETKEITGTGTGTGNPRLDEWLRSNGVSSDNKEDYEEAIEEYYAEFPNERPTQKEDENKPAEVQEEIDITKDMAEGLVNLISACDKVLLGISQNDNVDETTKKGAMTSLQEIKQSLFDSAEKVKKIKNSLTKKQKTTENE